MSNLKEQVNKTAEILNDIKSALEDQGVDTTGMTPKDYANAVRGVVNNITVDNISLIPILAFKYSEVRPDTPNGGSWNPVTGEVNIPEGWYTDIDLDYSVANKLLPLWMSTSVFSSSGQVYKKWSTPVRISGKDGQDGQRGAQGLPGTTAGLTQFFNIPIFYRGDSTQPQTPWASYDTTNNELSIQSGWSETIDRTDTEGFVYWQSYVKYNTANNPPAVCTTPIRMTAESSTVTGNRRYYQLVQSKSAPNKGTSSWKLWTEDMDIVPTVTHPYLYCYDETVYSDSNEQSTPVYLLAIYSKGLLDIDIAYAVGQENTIKKGVNESDAEYENRFGEKFWFKSSVEAISADKDKADQQHPDEDRYTYYPGLTENTQYLWCRETFNYEDHDETFYRIISYYKAAEKAPVLYSAGVYSDLTRYTRNDEQCPYVFYPTGLYLDENENVITKTEDGKIVPVVDGDADTSKGKKFQYFFLKTSYEEAASYDSFFESYNDKRWKKIDSFEAIYSDIGIFKSAQVGKFVFDDKYMFSMYGVDGDDGSSKKYEEYADTEGKVYDHEADKYKDRGGIAAAIDAVVRPNGNETTNKKFIPATLINAVTGESWFGNGTTKFYSNGEGDLANGAIGWRLESGKTEPTLYIDGDVKIGTRAPKPGAGPLESKSFNERLNEQDEKIKSSIQEVQDQIDGVVENWNDYGAPLLSTEPTKSWIEKGDGELIAHINDTYINIEEYVDDVETPTAGQAWRWCQCTEDSVETESITLSGYIGAPSTTIPIGTLPIKLNYTGNVRVYKNDQLLGTISISSLGNAGTINGLQIRTTTYGLVAIIDTTSNGANVGNINVEFEYYDYIKVKDNEDNVLNLHWHKIADSDSIKALKVAADALKKAEDANKTLSDVDRLKNTFGTIADVDGVSLSKAVAVKDRNNNIRTIIDGSCSYTRIGEIAIAAGVDTSASNISDGIHNAKLKIFNSGSLTIGETLDNSTSNKFPIYLKSDGGGHLACGNISWNTSGALNINGRITANGGIIGGFDIATTNDSSDEINGKCTFNSGKTVNQLTISTADGICFTNRDSTDNTNVTVSAGWRTWSSSTSVYNADGTLKETRSTSYVPGLYVGVNSTRSTPYTYLSAITASCKGASENRAIWITNGDIKMDSGNIKCTGNITCTGSLTCTGNITCAKINSGYSLIGMSAVGKGGSLSISVPKGSAYLVIMDCGSSSSNNTKIVVNSTTYTFSNNDWHGLVLFKNDNNTISYNQHSV